MDKHKTYYYINKAAAQSVYKNWAFAGEIQDSVMYNTSKHQVDSLIEKLCNKKQEL